MRKTIFISLLFLSLTSEGQVSDNFIYTKNEYVKFDVRLDSILVNKTDSGVFREFSKKLKDDNYTAVLQDSLPSGTWIIYFENGQEALRVSIKDNMKNGRFVRYWSNGFVREKKDFMNNLLNGEHSMYNNLNQVTSLTYYNNNEKYLAIYFYPNGQKSFMQIYLKGKETPKILYWDAKGNPLTPKQFSDYKLR